MSNKNLSVWVLAVVLTAFSVAMIIVAKNNPQSKCLVLLGNEKSSCVIRLLDKYIHRREIGSALSFVNNYQNKDKNFYATDCHGVVHYIGDKAYEFYKKGYDLDFGKFSNICVYGFYHAFTSSFILSGDNEGAQIFCDRLNAVSPKKGVGCYHGIGHGAIYNFHEDYGIVDPIKIINKSIDFCEKILSQNKGLMDCVSGVYDGIGDVVLGSTYQNLTPQKIYRYCEGQPDKYLDDCYQNISHLVFRKTQVSFKELVDFVMNSAVIKNKRAAIEGLATIYIVDLKGGDLEVGVAVCQELPNDIKVACLSNMAYKLASDALKNKHYEAARNFCGNRLLSDSEKSNCFALVVVRLTSFYSKEELISQCRKEQIDLYKNICLNELYEN